MRKVRLSKNFMPMRLISLFSVEFLSRILPIKFVVEPLCVSESLGLRKLLCSVRGHRDIPLVFLASQYCKISWVTPSTYGKFWASKLSMYENGKSRFSAENSLSHNTKKVRGNHF